MFLGFFYVVKLCELFQDLLLRAAQDTRCAWGEGFLLLRDPWDERYIYLHEEVDFYGKRREIYFTLVRDFIFLLTIVTSSSSVFENEGNIPSIW